MTVSKMPLSRPESIRCPDASTTSEATGRLSHAVVADHDERDVVARRLALAELANIREQALEKLRRRFRAERAMPIDRREQPVVHVLLARGIHRFSDAVTERHDEVAGLQPYAFLFERRVLEQTQHHAPRLETTNAGRRDEHGRIVSAVRERERAVAREHAVER